MSTRKAVVGGIITAAFTVFIATAPMYFFTTPFHPQIVFWLMVCSAVVCVGFSAAWFAVRGSDKVKTKASQSVDSSGDNSGAQMAAGRDIIFHAMPVPAPLVPVRLEPKPALVEDELEVGKSTPALPTLRINRRTEEVIFDYLQAGWRLAHQGEAGAQTALVLWIENVFPFQGNGRDLQNIIASINAEQFDSITMPRAYWLQCRDNEVTLMSGSRLGVLVGHFNGRDTFVSYANPFAPAIHYDILDDGFRPQAPGSTLRLILREGDTRPLRVIVTIAQMPTQAVIACKRLIITLPQLIIDMQECE